jgi:alpha-glucosidase
VVVGLFGFFHFREVDPTNRRLTLAARGADIVLLDGDSVVGRVLPAETESGDLRVQARLDGASATSLRLRLAVGPEDRFWGFGEQYNYVDCRSQIVPIWTQEQGVGRSPMPVLPTQGSLVNAYYPMPYFVDPGRGVGFLLENTEYSIFDLGRSDGAHWTVEVWNGREASFLVFPGPRPKDVIAQLTKATGRPTRRPPDWAFAGVWLGAQGGSEAVAERLRVAQAADVPVTALWVQDWVGERGFGLGNQGVKYHWTWDQQLYPNLPEIIADLGAEDVRFLGYFNPFVAAAYDQYAEAVREGYLVQRADGVPYIFPIITFVGGLLDVTNPAAAQWFQGYARAAIDLGMKGWMADFGEWLPFDARLHDGAAPSFHNLYPTAWHELNRAPLEDAYPDGDFVLLTRSGFTGEAHIAQVVWAGDQTASFDPYDGLPTVVTAGLTSGLSGVFFFSHDIAGFSGGPSDRELFWRWTELGAFTPVMRTHDGLQKDKNYRFDSDPGTLAHFARFAQIHEALSPYLIATADEAARDGVPMVRHTALVDPDWDGAFAAHGQWLIGDDLLIAPAVERGALAVSVAFPEGEWTHLLTGERFDGRQKRLVSAPLGRPAVFARVGSAVPADLP